MVPYYLSDTERDRAATASTTGFRVGDAAGRGGEVLGLSGVDLQPGVHSKPQRDGQGQSRVLVLSEGASCLELNSRVVT